MKIDFTRNTTKALEKRLRRAKKVCNVKQIQKISVILMIARGISIELVAEIWGMTVRNVYLWRNEFLCKRMEFFCISKCKGSKSRLTEHQKRKLRQIVIDGPEAAGFSIGIWNSAMIKELIERKFKKSYHVRYIPELLKSLGLSYQKAKFESAKNRSVEKKTWRDGWLSLLAQAEHKNAVILFEDESSFAMWGSLSYTWGLKGKQPIVKTCGSRKSLKVFGAIDYHSGRFIYKTFQGKINSQCYIKFLKTLILRYANKNIMLIHDGAPYHRSKDVLHFLQDESRMEAIALPSYTPEYNIIEYLWKKVKKHTHNKYYPDFAALKKCVSAALKSFQKRSEEILILCRAYPDMLFHNVPVTP